MSSTLSIWGFHSRNSADGAVARGGRAAMATAPVAKRKNISTKNVFSAEMFFSCDDDDDGDVAGVALAVRTT